MRPRLTTGLPLHRGPDSYWGHLSTQVLGSLSKPFVQMDACKAPTIWVVHLRRAILLFALVLGLTALAAAVSPSREDKSTVVAPAPPVSTAEALPRQVVLDTRRARPLRPLRARVDEHIVVTVLASGGGLATIPRLGRTATVSAAAPARFDLLAPAAGRYDVMLEPSDSNEPRRVGTLVTAP